MVAPVTNKPEQLYDEPETYSLQTIGERCVHLVLYYVRHFGKHRRGSGRARFFVAN